MNASAVRRAVSAALVSLVAAGCAVLPDSGPVEEGARAQPSQQAAPFDYNPPGPAPGGSPTEIVGGFLSALQATPVSTQVAAEYLTAEATARWRPDRRTIVYTSQRTMRSGDSVLVRLDEAFSLDRLGRFQGSRGSDPGRSLSFRLAREGGEWRITNPPDAMVVPRTHVQTRYAAYQLYFPDTTGEVLVPEPVYLPRGVQTPTALVAGLLAGPPRDARLVERSAFPVGIEVGVGVPVRADGTAEVPLSAEILDLDEVTLDLALAQLAWTLRQVDGVERLQITVDGEPVDAPGTQGPVDVDGWGGLSPAIAEASTDLFGLRGDAVVQLVGDDQLVAASLEGELAALVGRPRSLGVGMNGQQIALVSQGGTRAAVVGRDKPPEDQQVSVAASGEDLLRPVWDRTGRVWLLDSATAGARILVATPGESARELPTRGLLRPLAKLGPDPDVIAMSLSRDGTRIAVAARWASDGLPGRGVMLARVVRNAAGAPVRLVGARTVASTLARPIALGWRDPSTLAVLTRPSGTTSGVELLPTDASSPELAFLPAVDTLFDRGVHLAASPGGPTALLVQARNGSVQALTPQGRWEDDVDAAGLRLPTFVG